MPERPLLVLPSPGKPLARPRRFGGGVDFPCPTRGSIDLLCRSTACFRDGTWSMTRTASNSTARPIPDGTGRRWRRLFSVATWALMNSHSRGGCTIARSSGRTCVTGWRTTRRCPKGRLWSTLPVQLREGSSVRLWNTFLSVMILSSNM